MILAIDMGNTNIVLGGIDEHKTYFVERITTNSSKTDLEYAVNVKDILEIYNIHPGQIEGAILSSVVPPLNSTILQAVEKILGKRPLLVGSGMKTGLNIIMDNPKTVGSDMIVDAVAAIHEYPKPIVVIDMGTATTMSVLDREGTYIGGAIIPGLRLSMDALSAQAAQLPFIDLREPPARLIGTNTVDCMRSGAILGCAAMLDGLAGRVEEELGEPVTVVATGGLMSTVLPYCRRTVHYEEDLLLTGLLRLYQRNAG